MAAFPPASPKLRRRLLYAGLVALGIWLAFFDSHSLLKRVRWHQEHAALRQENEMLREEIATLREQLEEGLSDELAERIAREQYGMRRPDETVYRVESE